MVCVYIIIIIIIINWNSGYFTNLQSKKTLKKTISLNDVFLFYYIYYYYYYYYYY